MKQQNLIDYLHIIRIAIDAEFERLRTLWPRAERRARRTKTILGAQVDSYLKKKNNNKWHPYKLARRHWHSHYGKLDAKKPKTRIWRRAKYFTTTPTTTVFIPNYSTFPYYFGNCSGTRMPHKASQQISVHLHMLDKNQVQAYEPPAPMNLSNFTSSRTLFEHLNLPPNHGPDGECGTQRWYP